MKSALRGEVLRYAGETARLRKGLLEDKFTEREADSRAAVFGEGRRGSTGIKKCQLLRSWWMVEARRSVAVAD